MYKMQRLEVSGAVRPIYGSLGVKRLMGQQSPIFLLKFKINKSELFRAVKKEKDFEWG